MPQGPEPASFLLVEECFRSQNSQFLAELRKISSSKWLAAFADRWKRDTRPWARRQILDYFECKRVDLENVRARSPLPARPEEDAIRDLLLKCLEAPWTGASQCQIGPRDCSAGTR